MQTKLNIMKLRLGLDIFYSIQQENKSGLCYSSWGVQRHTVNYRVMPM